MKVSAIIAILTASLATAEVTWTFKKFENGVEVPFPAGPKTKFQSQAMLKVHEARKRNRLDGRASAATVDSSNWCGAALTGSGFSSVVGRWTVPSLSLRSGMPATPDPGLAQWVGIDGFSNSALIQGGTLSTLVGGSQENIAWTQMLPAALREVPLAVETGDNISTNVTMTSTTSGIVTIENNSRGTLVVGTVEGGTSLLSTSAEWILEDFASGSSLVPFPAFTSFTFTGSAIRAGASVPPIGPNVTLINLVQDVQLCSATLLSSIINVF